MANLRVFMIDYETDQATWKVKILAESKEDAMGFLMQQVGEKADGFKVNNFDMKDEVHAITSKVLEGIRGPEQEAEVIKEEILKCPWCESTDYSTNHALKMHIVKTHTGKTQKQ